MCVGTQEGEEAGGRDAICSGRGRSVTLDVLESCGRGHFFTAILFMGTHARNAFVKGPSLLEHHATVPARGSGFGRNATGCSMRLIPDSRAKKAVDVSQNYIHDTLAFTLRLTGLYWHFGSFPCIKSVLRFMFRRNCGTSPSTVMHAKGKANYKPQVDSLLTKLI